MPRGKIGRLDRTAKTIGRRDRHAWRARRCCPRARWHTVFGGDRPLTCPTLLFRILAYRLQADFWATSMPRASACLIASEAPEKAGLRAVSRRPVDARPGTVLDREWNGQMHG